MDKLNNMFSRSFQPEAIEYLHQDLERLYQNCNDELFVLFNDYKRYWSILGKDGDGEGLYTNNAIRSELAGQVNLSCLDGMNKTSNEYRLMVEILVMASMIGLIDKHLVDNVNEYRVLYDMFGKRINASGVKQTKYDVDAQLRVDNEEVERFSIGCDDNGKVKIITGTRDMALIAILLIGYMHFGNDWVMDFYTHMSRVNGESGEYNVPAEMNSKVFSKFHELIHLLGKSYTVRNIEAQFALVEVWSLVKALLIAQTYNGSTDSIDSSVVIDKCELDCLLVHNGVETSLSIVLLSSIYSFNKMYDWFNDERYFNFLRYYGNTAKILGIYVIDREKYNALYAFSIIYALRFANVSLSNTTFENVVDVPIDKLSNEFLTKSNRAMLFNVPDVRLVHEHTKGSKSNYYVIEVQDRVLYVSNKLYGRHESDDSYAINQQVMNDNNNKVYSYVIYNVLNNKLNNVEYICYSIDELRNVLKEYKEGKRGLVYERARDAEVNIDAEIDVMKKTIDNSNFVLRVVSVLLLITVIIYYLYANKNRDKLRRKITVYDKSLL